VIAELAGRITGVMAAPVTPFREDLSIDWAGVEVNLEFLLGAHVTAIVPCGSIGEASSLTLDERKDLVERTVEVVAGRSLVVAGTSAEDVSVAVELTEAAQKAGVDLAMVKVPHYYGLTDNEAFGFFATIDQIGCPFLVYDNPAAARHELSFDTIGQLRQLPHFVGLKVASADPVRFLRMLRRFGDAFPVIAGAEDPVFFNLIAGAQACLTATTAFSPQFMWAMVRAVDDGELSSAQALHDRLWCFRELLRPRAATGHPAYLTYTKAAMELLNLPAGPPRPPLLPLIDTEILALRTALTEGMRIGHRGELR